MDRWVVLLAVCEATGDANKVSFSAFSSTLEVIRRGKFESLQLCRACFGLPRPNLSMIKMNCSFLSRLGSSVRAWASVELGALWS